MIHYASTNGTIPLYIKSHKDAKLCLLNLKLDSVDAAWTKPTVLYSTYTIIKLQYSMKTKESGYLYKTDIYNFCNNCKCCNFSLRCKVRGTVQQAIMLFILCAISNVPFKKQTCALFFLHCKVFIILSHTTVTILSL